MNPGDEAGARIAGKFLKSPWTPAGYAAAAAIVGHQRSPVGRFSAGQNMIYRALVPVGGTRAARG
jgi:hypothetical protein